MQPPGATDFGDRGMSDFSAWLIERILESPLGRISFADYMEQALYHPTWGYYSGSKSIQIEPPQTELPQALPVGQVGSPARDQSVHDQSVHDQSVHDQSVHDQSVHDKTPIATDSGKISGLRSVSPIGARGDFFTAPHLGRDFGELLAVQFAQMWEILGQPDSWMVLEMGAGQGLLAGDILHALQNRECWSGLTYGIVERSPAMQREQRQHLQQFPELITKVRWLTWDEIPDGSIVGCCFSNELVDAFPVHQVVVSGGELREVYVTVVPENGSSKSSALESGTPLEPTNPLASLLESPLESKPTLKSRATLESRALLESADLSESRVASGTTFVFKEMLGPLSTPRIADYFHSLDIDLCAPPYPEGYRTEVNLAALDWLQTLSQRLHRGYVLTIDYGHPAQRYYNPSRSQGTLQCYYRHAHHANPYLHIGQQDMTAHVNWTALERWGDRLGLETLGFTPQALFLMALGLGDRLAAISGMEITKTQTLQDILARREALQLLINPLGMGNFGVLTQGKGLTAEEKGRSLRGLNTG